MNLNLSRFLKILITFFNCALLISCSSTGTNRSATFSALSKQPYERHPIDKKMSLEKPISWSKQLSARISYLSLGSKSGNILISSSNSKGGLTLFYNKTGKLLWSKPLPQPVRAQTLSDEKNLILLTSYDSKTRAFNFSGKQLFELDLFAKPIITEDKIILINDDDSIPDIAAYILSLKGDLLKSIEAPESLDSYLSIDQKTIFVIKPKKEIQIFSIDGKELKTLKNSDHIINVHGFVNTTSSNQLLILSTNELYLMNSDQKKIWTIPLKEKFESIAIHEGVVFGAGNSSNGQIFKLWSLQTGEELWMSSYPSSAQFSYPVLADNQGFTFIFEDDETPGIAMLVKISKTGGIQSITSIPAPNGIFSLATSEDGKFTVVGAGDSDSGILYFINN